MAKDYLSKYRDAFEMVHHHELVFLKDMDSQIFYCSERAAQLCGYANSEELIADQNNKFMPELLPIFKKQDQLVFATQEPHQFIDFYLLDDGMRVFMIDKNPIIDPQTNELFGLNLYMNRQWLNLDKLQMVYNVNRDKLDLPEIQRQREQIELTKRESEILFFLMYNKSSREIAYLLTLIERKSVSENTIKNIINQQLKPKFDALNLESLVRRAIDLGFDRYIPRNLMNNYTYHICHD